MPIMLVTGPANAGKARVVLEALRAHHARGEEPLLVVPTRVDVDHYRRELARGGLVLGVRVERFAGLLAEILRRAGYTERPIGRLARRQVLAAVLRRTAGERPTPGVVRSLEGLVGELEVGRVTPARLRGALGAWADADPAQTPHACALGELFEAYRGALGELTPARVDPERRAARALDTLRRAPALWGSTPVLMYGFDDFAELQLDAIETLGAVVGAQVTVSLIYEPGRTAFAGRGDTFQRLLPLASEHLQMEAQTEHYAPRGLAETGTDWGDTRSARIPKSASAEGACPPASVALHHLERHLFEPDRPPPVSAAEAVRLLEGGGERAELELVAEDIQGLLERGVAPGEIAVAHRSPEAIAELLGEVFRAHDIPFALERRLSFAHTAIGRALVGLLQATFEDGEDGLGNLLAWLRAPGVLRRPELADALERQARRAGAHTAARARALWEAEHWPLEALDRLREAADSGPATLIERAAEELERLFCAPHLRAAQVLAHAELPEARALSVGRAALRELAQLARSTPALAPDPRELIAILRGLELLVGEESPAAAQTPHGVDSTSQSRADSTAQDGVVAVLDPLALRARRVRALFLCGLQEGVFPSPARPETYLSEEERRGLAEASGLRLGRPGDALAAERYLLYAAVSRPEELLVLSWHTADDDGLPTARSLFVDDVCDLFSCDLHETRTRRALGEVGEMSGSEVAALGVPQADPPAGGPPGSGHMDASVDYLRPEIAPLRDPRVLSELGAQRLWSASGLQSWAGCPVRWFVERLLDASDLNPEAEPLARGGLAHDALRATLEGLRKQTGSARLTPELLPRARELLHAALEKHAGEHPLSTAPERVPGVRRRLEADLERYLEHAATCDSEQQIPLEPAHLELSFGFPEARVAQPTAGGLEGGAAGGRPPGGSLDRPGALPPLDLGDGVLVRGRIDRVDLAPGGEAVVYDYKSARAPLPDRWVRERDFQIGIYMRAVEELLGARVVGGFYQPLSGRDLRARGVLAEGEGVELPCVRGDAREPAEVQELVEEILTAARAAATQARAGELQARPDTCGFAGGCMYPSICRCEP